MALAQSMDFVLRGTGSYNGLSSYVALAHTMVYRLMWHWLIQWSIVLCGTGSYNGLSSYVALAPTMIDFCTVVKGCSFFVLLVIYFALVFPGNFIK